jgi:hypothetical protein
MRVGVVCTDIQAVERALGQAIFKRVKCAACVHRVLHLSILT